jgi:brefeldin A-inhibited guanine nucleotide-exchange protein
MELAGDARVIPSSPSPLPDGLDIRLQPDDISVAMDSHDDGGRVYPGEDSNVEEEHEKGEETTLHREVQVKNEVGAAEDENNRLPVAVTVLQNAPAADAFAERNSADQVDVNGNSELQDGVVERMNLPPTPPAKQSALLEPTREPSAAQSSNQPAPPLNGHVDSSLGPSASPGENSPVSITHRRSLTISKGHTVSVVLISAALEAIAASKEAKRSAPLRDSTHKALEMIRSNQAGDHPREVFEPLRLACETRNEKLMIASLDCISKLISYSFFAESDPYPPVVLHSPPPSPRHPNRNPGANTSQSTIAQPSLVDLVAHTITSCHTETTPETVSLQIVKALLSLVLSPTILVHHSSLLKAVRTVYNVFLLSTDPVNQMVAQGGLTQIVHHVFTRCRTPNVPRSSNDPALPSPGSQESVPSSARGSSMMATPESEHIRFANDRSGDIESSSEHGMLRSLPLLSDLAESHEVEPEVTNNIKGRKLPDEPQSQTTLYVMHTFALRDYTQNSALRQSFEATNPLDSLPEMEHTYELTSNDLFVKDAFLVFRALCKLTMKPLNNERYVV